MTMLKGDKLKQFVKTITAKPKKIHSTGVKSLDMVMGGGYIDGDFIEFATESGLGKTTALLDVSKYLLSQDKKILYLDTEFAIKETEGKEVSMLDSIGLTPFIKDDNFLVLNPTTFTELENVMLYAIEAGYHHVMVDSITLIIPEGVLDRAVESIAIAEKARTQTTFLEKYRAICKKRGVTVWFVNQLKTKIAINYGEQTKLVSSGSKSLKYLCDIWIRAKGAKKLKKDEKTYAGVQEVVYGCLSEIYTEKCRSERGLIEVPFPVLFGVGISNPILYFDILKRRGLITVAGAYLTLNIPVLPEPVKTQGELKMFKFIGKNKDLIQNYIESIGGFKLVSSDDEN